MKKKISGQTIAIIVLAILLLLVLVFGGVYAIYNTSTDQISGRIIMANLKIDFDDTAGSSGSSDVWFSLDTPVVPNQPLGNTPLVIINGSNTPIFIALFYKIDIKKIDTNEDVEYDLSKPIIDVGANGTNGWFDYYYQKTIDEKNIEARSLVLYVPGSSQRITAVPENTLKLDKDVGNELQNCSLKFTFQAYAIAANSFESEANFGTLTPQQKSARIVDSIFVSHNYSLKIYE